MSEVLTIILPMPPSNINHMYKRGKYGNVYKDPVVGDWVMEAKNKIHKKEKLDLKERYCVNIGFYFGNKRKNDIDGKIKSVLDLLTASGVYSDDSLVSDLLVAKRFDKENPRLEISVY